MDMDDPWGSPWADEIQPPRPVKTTEQFDRVRETPRARDPVQASSLALQDQTKSFWGGTNAGVSANHDDAGFGDWAAVPSSSGISLESPNDGWAGGTEDNSSDKGLNKAHTNGFSTGWDDASTALKGPAVKLGPSLLPESTNIARHPSPDPWAFIPETDAKSDTNNTPTEGLEDQAQANRSPTIQHTQDDPHNDQGWEDHSLTIASEAYTAPTIPASDNEDDESEKATEEGIHHGPSDLIARPNPSPSHQDIGPTSSIPSSSPSDRSQHDGHFPESPRTSMDEDPKRPRVPRKSSSKVQELVQHFDTLAMEEETKETMELASGHTSVAEGHIKKGEESGESQDEEDGGDDFGDFEDGSSEVDGSVLEPRTHEVASPSLVSNTTKEVTGYLSQEAPSPDRPQKKDYGPIEFIPEISIVDRVYPDMNEPYSGDKCFIPDVVPHDSFTSTEERKMWYRISRYGPMRQHNTGDDENYVRVNWTKSQVRGETLKVVGRWIDEDRISGRVVLGGGSKAGSMFGWNDTKAKPASISTAFSAKKAKEARILKVAEPAAEVPREWPKGLVRDRSTSKGRSSSKPRRRSSVKSIKTPEKSKSEKQLPVAAFGWSTDISSDSTQKPSARRPTLTHRSSGSTSSIVSPISNASVSIQNAPSRSLPQSSSSNLKPTGRTQQTSSPVTTLPTILSPSVPPQSSQILALAPTPAHNSNEADDWGEMVSSPITATPPVIQPSKGLRHKKSQSLGGFITSAKQGPTSPQAQAPYEPTHRSTASFDNILIPETRSLQSIKAAGPNNPSHSMAIDSGVQAAQPAAAAPIASNVDPWASADFSFFESASAPPAPPEKPAVPIPRTVPSRIISSPRTHIMASASTSRRKSRHEVEQDRIVQSIVKSLPDLSYMLKR
ncbi:uncharacterized protein BP5553_00873 [Venustampulla echinocandica]|uniref:Uncharacterized protein n=1 Tax=Venustampulla echinocandica TaxID=2656787 RepID=A0A370TZE9_9HELO|nr:uncharacterized protein BP5553_00873 [Venustampulla echinocandica]RDL40894.1 hypothetical protein BP5553_00873 [Venustampulla echinocandica]